MEPRRRRRRQAHADVPPGAPTLYLYGRVHILTLYHYHIISGLGGGSHIPKGVGPAEHAVGLGGLLHKTVSLLLSHKLYSIRGAGLKSMPLVWGKQTRPPWAACRKASSRVAPNDTPTWKTRDAFPIRSHAPTTHFDAMIRYHQPICIDRSF